MDCGGVLVKYILFLFNILFVVCGILIIVFGSLMVKNMDNIPNIFENFETHSVPIAILVLGCLILVIAFLGCCGAIRENTCCTLSYSVIMLVLFVCQLAVICYVWTQREEFLKSVDKVITKIWEQRHIDQKVMDTLQLTFSCCGKNAATDYTLAGESIPLSCCGIDATSCSFITAATRSGCSRAFGKFWENNIDIIRFAGLGVAGVELTAFIFACCLANQVRNSYRRANY